MIYQKRNLNKNKQTSTHQVVSVIVLKISGARREGWCRRCVETLAAVAESRESEGQESEGERDRMRRQREPMRRSELRRQ